MVIQHDVSFCCMQTASSLCILRKQTELHDKQREVEMVCHEYNMSPLLMSLLLDVSCCGVKEL